MPGAVFPDLASRAMEVEVDYINRCVGVDLHAAAIAELLSRMALTAEAVRDGQAVSVEVPPTRSDVLHACDVMEVGPSGSTSRSLGVACDRQPPSRVAGRHLKAQTLHPCLMTGLGQAI